MNTSPKKRAAMYTSAEHPSLSFSDKSSTASGSTNTVSSAQNRDKSHLVHPFLILAQVFFGAGSVVAGLGLPSCNPFAFALYREIIAGAILLGAYLYQSKSFFASCRIDQATLVPSQKHLRRFLALGMAVFGTQAGSIVGIKLAGPVSASIWQPSQPIITAAICMAFQWEPWNRIRVFGVGVAFMGCVLMAVLSGDVEGTKIKGNRGMSFGALAGNLLFFVNCLSSSLYVIMSKKVLGVYPSLAVTAWSYNIAALLFMAPTAFLVSRSSGVMNLLCPDCPSLWFIPQGAYFALWYFIFFNSVAAYGIMTWANQYVTGTLVMGYTVLQPVTAAGLIVLLLGLSAYPKCEQVLNGGRCLDPPAWDAICGMAGVFLGLYLVIRTEPSNERKSSSEQSYEAVARDDDVEFKSDPEKTQAGILE